MKSLDQLDEIAWNELGHAYGTAEDVPELLRKLEKEPSGLEHEESALWHLYGNIWHQGTVYEATSYVVPFLLTLAADPNVPKRAGIVGLLGAIANGNSYLDVHEEFMDDIGMVVDAEEHKEQKAKELEWVANAKSAVAEGLDLFLELSREEDPDVSFCATEVLSRLGEFGEAPKNRILEMLNDVSVPEQEACLLMMLSRMGKAKIDGLVYSSRLDNEHRIVRRAATAACLKQEYQLDSELFRKQMIEAVLDKEHEEICEGELLAEFWEIQSLPKMCVEKLNAKEKKQLLSLLCDRLERLDITVEQTESLLDIAFPSKGVEKLTHEKLSSDHRRVISALIPALNSETIEINSPHDWGLPEYRRDMKNLIEGKPPITIDHRLPLLGLEADPGTTAVLDRLKPGDRVHHRNFGYGTIKSFDELEGDWEIEFDEEGTHWFGFHQSDLSPQPWWTRFLGRLNFGSGW